MSLRSPKCAASCTVCRIVIAVACLVGCSESDPDPSAGSDGGPAPVADAGTPGPIDGQVASLGTLELSLELDEDRDVLDTTLSIASIQVVGDRGTEFGVERNDVGTVRLSDDPLELEFRNAVPGTYGTVTLDLQGGDGSAGGYDVSLIYDDSEYRVRDDSQLTVVVRCESPAFLEPGGRLSLELELEAEEVSEHLEDLSLPPPDAMGVIQVTPSTVGTEFNAIREDFRRAFRLDCEPS